MKVILAQPRGFCAGVVRAIDIVERALEKYGAPVYVRHEIVHNKHVVDTPQGQGRALRRGAVRGSRRRRHRSSAPTACRKRSRKRRRRARPAGPQRHLPAGDEGAQPGQDATWCRGGR